MRFFVEVTPIGQSETQRYCVEAASWQVALQNTRTLRNDAGPISGFSIELTDEGCRAVDPMARLRFMVKQAPDSAPLTGDRLSDAPTKIQESPLFKEQVAAALAASAAAAGAQPPSAAAVSAALGSAPAPSEKAEKPSEKVATSKKVPSRTIAYGSSGAIVTREPADRLKELASITVQEEPANVIPPAPITKPTLSSDGEARVLFHREQDPTAASPLTYREDVLAVAPGTTEEAAAKILRKHLEFVQNAIIGARPGKYVNLAIFDQVFEGKPPVLPLVILSWKDWQVEPLQSFPRRAKAPAGPTQASSHMAPAAAQAIAAAVPAFPPRPSPLAAVPLVTKAVVPDPQPAAPNVAASAPPPALAALGEALAKANSAPPPAMQTAEPAAPPPGIAALAAAFAPPQQPNAPPVAMMPISAFVPVAQPAPVFAVPAPAPQVAAPIVMPPRSVVVTETPPPVAAETPPPKGSSESARLRLSRPPSSPNLARVRGDELIAILFEEMHDLHFLNDAIEGGAFCLGLALEKLPSRAGIVHLYDINKREFVIVTAIGKGTEHLLARRHGEADPLLAAAMRKRNSVVMNNADSNDEAFVERYELIGGAKCIIISPVMKGGRFLGAIELINPLDGAPFTEDDGNALAYMSEQYAEFVSVRGVLIDPERIAAAAARPR